MTVTLDAAHAGAAKVLADGGVDTPALDARVLLKSVTGLTLEALIGSGREPLPPELEERFTEYVDRRLAGEPVSRIRGRREFYGREFHIDPHTLDPRPDTEALIGAGLEIAARANLRDRPLQVLDLGTGSGCILVTLLSELPQATGKGVDISPGALVCAQENARHLGVERRARFVAGDWFEGLTGRFDLIVSNPPYIESAEIAALAPEVARHDPRAALDGGPDGLDGYRRIAEKAGDFLVPGGHLLVEIGRDQAQAVSGLFRAAGLVLAEPSVVFDLAGRPRCIHAQSPHLEGGGRSHDPKNRLGQRGCSG